MNWCTGEGTNNPQVDSGGDRWYDGPPTPLARIAAGGRGAWAAQPAGIIDTPNLRICACVSGWSALRVVTCQSRAVFLDVLGNAAVKLVGCRIRVGSDDRLVMPRRVNPTSISRPVRSSNTSAITRTAVPVWKIRT